MKENKFKNFLKSFIFEEDDENEEVIANTDKIEKVDVLARDENLNKVETKQLEIDNVPSTNTKSVFDTLKNESSQPKVVQEVSNIRVSTKNNEKAPKKKTYTYVPIISPMFGMKEEESKKIVIEKKEVVKENLEQPKSALGTIISPIYGSPKIKENISSLKQNNEKVVEKNEVGDDISKLQMSLFDSDVLPDLMKTNLTSLDDELDRVISEAKKFKNHQEKTTGEALDDYRLTGLELNLDNEKGE